MMKNPIKKLLEPHRMGWYADKPDSRDYDYERIAYVKNIATDIDLREYLTRVLYQKNAPSCVGFAPAHNIMITERVHGLRGSIPAAGYIYAMTRTYHQGRDLEITGTHPRYAWESIKRYGCPAEFRWKYSTNAKYLTTIPPQDVWQQGASRIGLEYYRIKAGRGHNIRRALSEKRPVSFGTQVTQKTFRYKYPEILQRPSGEKLEGGHYMTLIGYDGRKNAYLAINSWYGREFIWFHENYIEWMLSSDFYVITGWNALGGKR
jgi:hypothetical protein